MSALSPSPDSALVILLGASTFPEDGLLEPSTAFAHSVALMRDYFLSESGFCLPVPNLLSLFDCHDEPNRQDKHISSFLAGRIAALAAEGRAATDLIVYYVGHGLFDRAQQYCLALQTTRQANRGVSSLRLGDLATTLSKAAEGLRVYCLIDACFSGEAIQHLMGPQVDALKKQLDEADQLPRKGISLLCSSANGSVSRLVSERNITMFSESLVERLREGDASIPVERLSLRQLHEAVTITIRAKNWENAVRPELHSPKQLVGDIALVPLFPNNVPAVRETRLLDVDDRPTTGTLRVVFDSPDVNALVQWEEKAVLVTQPGKKGNTLAEVKPGELLRLPSGEYRLRVTDEDYKTEQPLTVREGANPDLHVRLLDIRSFKGKDTSSVRSVAYIPASQHFAASRFSWEGDVDVWDAPSGKLLFTLPCSHTWTLSASPDGKRLATIHNDERVRVWDAQTGQAIHIFPGMRNQPHRVAFSPDGKYLAGASLQWGFVRVWDLETGEERLSLEAAEDVRAVIYSSNGKHLFIFANWVTVHDAQTGKKLYSMKEINHAHSAALSPDGQRLAIVVDGKLRLWDWQTRKEVLAFQGDTSDSENVAFSRDGKRLACTSRGATVTLWDAQTGQEILTIDGNVERIRKQTGQFNSVAVSPDGKSLLTGSEGPENLCVWTLPE